MQQLKAKIRLIAEIPEHIRKAGLIVRIALVMLALFQITETVLKAVKGRRIKPQIREGLKDFLHRIPGNRAISTEETVTGEESARLSAEETGI